MSSKDLLRTMLTVAVVPVALAPASTAAPSDQQLSGRALLVLGATGEDVTKTQQQLTKIGISVAVTGTYDGATVKAVKQFQSKFGYREVGDLTDAQQRKLNSLASIGVPKKCLRAKAIICGDETLRIIRFYKNGKIKVEADARYFAKDGPVPPGNYRVQSKDRFLISGISGTPMPFSVFFSGNRAIHYSQVFADHGYDSASLGCVGLRDKNKAKRIFNLSKIGTPFKLVK
jgi:peptidoglycan hydrolase-like protein with peptidoglycan-binding domain